MYLVLCTSLDSFCTLWYNYTYCVVCPIVIKNRYEINFTGIEDLF